MSTPNIAPANTPRKVSPTAEPYSLFEEEGSVGSHKPPSSATDDEAYEHFLVSVLRQPSDGYIAWALEDNNYPKFVETFSFLTEGEIDGLCYRSRQDGSEESNLQEPATI